MKIYTKTGDTGLTSLYDGTRIYKNNEIIDMLGMIDELNSYIGLINSLLKKEEHTSEHNNNYKLLTLIQVTLLLICTTFLAMMIFQER